MKPDERQLDALSELMNIGVGRAAGMLNQMVDSPIELRVPVVRVLLASALARELGQPSEETQSFVRMPFRGALQGTAALLFPPASAANLVAALTGEERGTPDLDSVRAGTLSEVGNIVINGVMGSIGNVLQLPLSYDLPTYLEASLAQIFHRPTDCGSRSEGTAVLVAHTRFTVRGLEVEGTVLLIFEVLSLDALLLAVDQTAGVG